MTSDDSYTPGQSPKHKGAQASVRSTGSGGGVSKRSGRRARSSDDAIAERLVAELAQTANGPQSQMKAGGQSDSLTATTGTGTATPRSAGTVATVSGRSTSVGRGSPEFSDEGQPKARKRRSGATAGGAGASQQELHSMPPARVKRILANRQSAARSKERKLAYITELEAQVSALTMQLTSASLQLRSLQQDTSSLGECNKSLSQQAMVLREHMAQRDAETSMLLAELRRAQGLLAAHNIPMGEGLMLQPPPLSPQNTAASAGATPFQHPPPNMPKLAGVGNIAGLGPGLGGSSQGINSLMMAEAAAAAAAAGARNGHGISPELQQRAQMQAMERHQAQQRLWSNSVSSATDAFSPQASPRLDPALLQQHLAAGGAPVTRPLAVPSLGGGSAGSTMANSSNLSGKTAADLLADLRKRSTSGRSSDGLDGFANNYGGSSGNIAAATGAGGGAPGAAAGFFPPMGGS